MTAQSAPRPVAFTPTAAVVRYQTPSVDRAVAFYTQHLGTTMNPNWIDSRSRGVVFKTGSGSHVPG